MEKIVDASGVTAMKSQISITIAVVIVVAMT